MTERCGGGGGVTERCGGGGVTERWGRSSGIKYTGTLKFVIESNKIY